MKVQMKFENFKIKNNQFGHKFHFIYLGPCFILIFNFYYIIFMINIKLCY